MRRLLLVGLNHKTAPLEVREKLGLAPESRKSALAGLRETYPDCEAVILSTCNRVEIYTAREVHGHPRDAELEEFLARQSGVAVEKIRPHLYCKHEKEVVEHLFSVAASLDSMVLGETQILAQVRGAYEEAKDAGSAGAMLHPLFQRAVAVGKQVRAETPLSEGRVSVASVAVDRARRVFDVFSDKTVLTIGAGKMAELVIGGIAALKPGRLLVCNRDEKKAEVLAGKFGGQAAGFEKLAEHLAAADIVISSTGATEPIVSKAMFESAMKRRRYRSVFVIDIAVPRDVAPAVGEIENVYLFNLDDLQQAVAATMDRRSLAAREAEGIIEQHVKKFAAWHRARMMGPLIEQLYQRSHALAQEELAKAVTKLPSITNGDKAQLEELTRRIVNKLLHDPIQVLRESETVHSPMTQYLHAVEKLFKLEADEGPAVEVKDEAGKDEAGKGEGQNE